MYIDRRLKNKFSRSEGKGNYKHFAMPYNAELIKVHFIHTKLFHILLRISATTNNICNQGTKLSWVE